MLDLLLLSGPMLPLQVRGGLKRVCWRRGSASVPHTTTAVIIVIAPRHLHDPWSSLLLLRLTVFVRGGWSCLLTDRKRAVGRCKRT